MKVLFSKSLIPYVLILSLTMLLTGAILTLVVNDFIVLISVLGMEYIVIILILLHVFDKYIKPIQKASKTMTELVKGNYRARIHHPISGSIGELMKQINVLARNLTELSINEQMQAEQLTTVIDNTESGLVLLDEKGYIHLVNRKFLSLFGKTDRDYIGYLYYDVLENEKIHSTVQQTFLYEENVKEFFTLKKNGSKKYIEIVGAPIFNERNLLKGAVLVLYDITELKKLEGMRKDFVANVSHELKTPITSIAGFAETLLDEDLQNEETNRKFTKIIYEESKRLQVLIEDLLTLSRLEKDDFQLSFSKFTVSGLISEVISMMERKQIKAGIDLHVRGGKQLTLIADYDRVKQVLINLLSNAINYTPEGGEIEIFTDEIDDCILIRVTDNGIGIPKEAIPRLFERFYRVDKARSRNTGGTGLGLAIVKHIVEVHKGKITVESELNTGSVFSVYFPKAPEA